MSKNHSFVLNAVLIGLAILSIVSLILFRIKISQLQTQQKILESEISSYSERISELEDTND